jgi:hypothetical protein
MSLHPRTAFLAVGAFLLAAFGWVVAGWAAHVAGLDELDLPARVGGMFLALSLGEAAVSRFFGSD